MTYTRSEFLDLFSDPDPYEDILGNFEWAIEQLPLKLDQAEAYRLAWRAGRHFDWDAPTVINLSDWMVSIQRTLKILIGEGDTQGTGLSMLNVAFYNALFDKVTAERIMQAWINTTKTIRLMTILTIDELRREVWNEEIVSYKIAPPLGES